MKYEFEFTGQMIPARPGIVMVTVTGERCPVEAWGVFAEVKINDDGERTHTGTREARPLVMNFDIGGLYHQDWAMRDFYSGPWDEAREATFIQEDVAAATAASEKKASR